MGSRAGCFRGLQKTNVERDEERCDELQDQTGRTAMGSHRRTPEPSLGLRMYRARVRYACRRFADRRVINFVALGK